MVLSCCTIEEIRSRWHAALRELFDQDIVSVSDSNGIRSHLQKNTHDLVLLHLPSVGSERRSIVAELLQSFPDSKIIAFSNTPNEEEGIAVLKSGAMGYCNTYMMPELLRKAVSGVRDGQVWVGQDLLHRLIANLPAPAPASGETRDTDKLGSLTAREKEIAKRVAEGASNKIIAYELDIAERTVKAHIGTIFKKVGVTDRLQLALRVRGLLA